MTSRKGEKCPTCHEYAVIHSAPYPCTPSEPHPRFRVSISTPDITTTIYLNPNIPADTERLTSPILAALTDLERTALLTQLIGQVIQAHQEWGVA